MPHPVSRAEYPNFEYTSPSGFTYTVDGNRHARADPSTLHALLTYTPPVGPALTKKGTVAKRQPPPYKDSPGHFYAAQAYHYGLQHPKPLKMKEPLKKRLLAAFVPDAQATGRMTLAVPAELLQLEAEFKIEWSQATAVWEKQHQEDMKARQIEMRAREVEEEKRRAAQREEQKGLMSLFDTAFAGDGEESDSEEDDNAEDERIITPGQLSKHVQTMPEKALRDLVCTLVVSGNSDGMLDEALTQDIKRTQKAATKLKKAAKVGGNSKPAGNAKAMTKSNLSGRFEVVVPYVTEQYSSSYDDSVMTLRISPSSTSSHLWASFDFGIYTGVFRAAVPSHRVLPGTAYAFKWRGRESGEGETTFGARNTGTITFMDANTIKGRMKSDLGNFRFLGQVKDRLAPWPRCVKDWKREYRGYNQRTYDNASRARWGGWGGEDYAEPAAPSDTTDTEKERDEDSDGFEEDEDEERGGYLGRNMGFAL